MSTRPVWLIGCGNMAGAMLEGWLRAGETPKRFHVIDPGGLQLPEGVTLYEAPPQGGFDDAIVQLGFKPHMLSDIGPALEGAVDPRTLVTSIMAGVEIATLRVTFPKAGTIIRIMPNMPVALGKGAIGMMAEQPESDAAGEIEKLLAPLGTVERLTNEDAINVMTVLSGSGPAFLYRFIDALASAGKEIGLDCEQSLRLVIATAEGAVALAAQSDDSPAELAEKVASPGGTTRAGLDVLDDGKQLMLLISKTLKAAKDRAEEMAEKART